MKRVLILTAGFGEGHNTAAWNIERALREELPGTECSVRDPFACAYPFRNRLAQWAYALAINRAPALWSVAFDTLDKTPLAAAQIGIYRKALRILRERIERDRPSAIVSTYPGCNLLLDRICRARVCRPFRTVTVITDSISVNSAWHAAHTDAFVVAEEITAEILAGRGVPASLIHPLGFPVAPEFGRLRDLRPPPAPPWRILFVVNGDEDRAARIAIELSGIPDVELTVAVGRRERLAASLERKLGGLPVRVVGWVSDMPARMLTSHAFVGKAGGASVHECLAAGLPMFLVQVVPGQEEGNAGLAVRCGAGIVAREIPALSEAVRAAVGSGGLERMADAARATGRPHAARDIARFISTLLNP